MSRFQFVLVVVALMSYVASVTFTYLRTAKTGVFYNSADDLDNKYYQQVTPKRIAFSIIWPIIFLWNAVGAVYLFVSLFLSERSSPVKMEPTLVPKRFLISYALVWTTAGGWLFAFDREILELSVVLIFLAAASAYVTVGISYKRVYYLTAKLESESKVVLWMMRIVIQNGLCLVATWLTIATLFNLADVMIYKSSFGINPAIERGSVSRDDGSTVALVLLMIIVIAWFVLENFVWEKYCSHTFTIYPVFILALSALIDKLWLWTDVKRNLVIACVDLAIVLTVFIARIILSVTRWKKRTGASSTTTTSVPLEGLG